MSDIEHGTYAAYQFERKHGVPTCDECREAARLYMADYRKRGLPGALREQKAHRARQAALWRLKDMYRADFDLLVADEMRYEDARERRETAS